MRRFWKFHREDQRKKWEEERTEEILHQKRKRQQMVEDSDLAPIMAAVGAVLCHIRKGKQK